MRKLYVSGICTLALAALLFSSVGSAKPNEQAPPAATASAQFKTYREWKNTMVGAAELRIQKTKQSLEKQRQSAGAGLDPNLKNQLSKELFQASIASELTINDYFIGYLNKQNNLQQAIQSLAGKLSDEEVAELMSAHAYNFNKINRQLLRAALVVGPKAVDE